MARPTGRRLTLDLARIRLLLLAGCLAIASCTNDSSDDTAAASTTSQAQSAAETAAVDSEGFAQLPQGIVDILEDPMIETELGDLTGAVLFETQDNAGWIVDAGPDVACYIGVERYENAVPDLPVTELTQDELIALSSCGDRSILDTDGYVSIDQTPNKTLAIFILPTSHWDQDWEAELILPLKGYELLNKTSRSITFERGPSPAEDDIAVLEVTCECGNLTLTAGL